MLSVFLNLDPAQFATRRRAVVGDHLGDDDAAHKVKDCRTASTTTSGWRCATTSSACARCSQRRGVAANGTRAVAVYACGPAELLEVVRAAPARRLERGRRPHPVRRAAGRCRPTASAGASCSSTAARRGMFVGPGDALEETDRIVDDVHSQHDQGGWSQSNYQRSVEKEVHDHLGHAAELAFDVYKARAVDRVLIGAPARAARRVQGQAAPVPARADRRAAAARRRERLARRRAQRAPSERSRRTCRAASARRWTGSREGVGRGGARRGGIADVLDALNQARVETLLIAENFAAPGARDVEAGCCCPPTTLRATAAEPVRRHRRAGDREGDRAVRRGAGRAPPRRPRAARRHRRRAAVLRCASPSWARGSWARRWRATSPRPATTSRVWNRTREQAEALGATASTVAGDAAEAVRGRRRRRDDALRRRRGGARRWTASALRDDAVWWQASTVGVAASSGSSPWPATRRRVVDGRCSGTKQPAEQGKLDRARLRAAAARERCAPVFDAGRRRRSSTSATSSAPARA